MEVEMDALRWEFAGQEISLQNRAEDYNSHKFDLKDEIKPLMLLQEGGDPYRSCAAPRKHERESQREQARESFQVHYERTP